MPPPQCPDCGRFLSHDFVEGLTAEPAACPRCGTVLRADQFELVQTADTAPDTAPDTVHDAAEEQTSADVPENGEVGAPSVRPPDLDPGAVRERVHGNGQSEGERDVLEGWDLPGVAAPIVEDSSSEELMVAAGTILVAGVAGGLVGALVSGRHRTLGAVVGTLAGASVAAAGSRVFSPVGR